MKPNMILLFSLVLGTAHAQDITHEDNGDGLKLSLDGPGVKGSASAGGGGGRRSVSGSAASGTGSHRGGSAGSSEGAAPGPVSSVPDLGTTGGFHESTVYLRHNGKSVRVTRRPSRYGGEEVVVTTTDGGKEKTEEMSLAEYERKYLGKKAPKDTERTRERGRNREPGQGQEDKADSKGATGDRIPEKTEGGRPAESSGDRAANSPGTPAKGPAAEAAVVPPVANPAGGRMEPRPDQTGTPANPNRATE